MENLQEPITNHIHIKNVESDDVRWFVMRDLKRANAKYPAYKMLKEMGTGLVVTELMGQGVSAITGDYSRGAAGFWVENGEIQYPVSEITIAGNLKDMWRNIVTVGNDIETRSNIQCGSVLLPEMKIAGQ